MNLRYAIGLALGFLALSQISLAQSKAPVEKRLTRAGQLLVVKTAGWNAVQGTLQRYARTGRRRTWQPVGSPIPIVVGRNGLAWGNGLHGTPEMLAQGSDPLKKEGDGKAPAGVFSLDAAFGYLPKRQVRRVKLPYAHSTATLQCVDDAQSAYYNRIVDRARINQPDWQSHEDMRRQDELYRWGIVVNHNAGGVGRSPAKATPQGGSCIFLHIWGGADSSTSGCTAMEPVLMKELLFWLDARQLPTLVQLTQPEYERFQQAWKLPDVNPKPVKNTLEGKGRPDTKSKRQGGLTGKINLTVKDDGEIVSDTISADRELQLYDQAGHFDCRRWASAPQKNRDPGSQTIAIKLKTARDFIWEHWENKRRGYVRLTFDSVDAHTTVHLFIEPDERSSWSVSLRYARLHALSPSRIDDLPRIYAVEQKWKETTLVGLVFKDAKGDVVTDL